MTDVAQRIPPTVFCWMVGCDVDRGPELAATSAVALQAFSGDPAVMGDVVTAIRALRQFADELIEEKRASPGDDITSALVTAIDEGLLRERDARSLLTELLSASVDNTTNSMDWQWEYGPHSEDTLIPRRPSEYWADQCFVGSSIMTHYEVAHRDEIGVTNMMFGTDFPHSEGTFGKTVPYLNFVLSGTDITEPEVRALLGENAARCYNLDLAHMQSLADVVGPTIEEIMYQPLLDAATRQAIAPGLSYGSEPGWATFGGPQPFGLGLQMFEYLVFNDPNWDYRTLNFGSDMPE